jgi:catecholate siderophore receptor
MAISRERRAPARLKRELMMGAALTLAFTTSVSAQAQQSAPGRQGAQQGSAAAVEDQIVILGERGEARDSSIGRLTQPVVDTPQSITLISEFEIEARAISNLNDALRSAPGVTLGAGEFSWQGNAPTIRGFVARNDIYLDGMRDFGNYYRDPFNLQQLEILQGPSSVYFGRGSTGGVINQTAKRPTREDLTSLSVAAGMENTYRVVGDIERRAADTVAVRATAMVHHNEIAERDVGEYSRWGVAPSLALGLGTPTRLTASYFHQSEDNIPDYGLPWYFGRPAPVERDTFYGHDSDWLETDVDIGTLRLEHDLSDAVTIRNQLRYGHYTRDFRISEAVLAAGTTQSQPLDTVQVSYNMWSGDATETFLQNQLDAVMQFGAGGIEHTLVAGLEVGKETSDPVFEFSVGVPNQPLLNPDPTRPFVASVVYPRLTAETEAETLAFYAIDTIRLSERWELALGVRWDRFDSDYHGVSRNPAGAITLDQRIPQVDEAPSGRVALTYKPTPDLNVYVAAGTSFNPSAEALSQITSGRALGTQNSNLDPEENETWEAGFKLDLFNSQAMLTGAVFKLTKTNARVPDPLNSNFNILDGEQQVQGFQLQLVGNVTEDWYLSAAYSYLDSEVVKAQAGAPSIGRPLLNTPENSASLLTEYRILPVFTIGAAATYLDERLAQNTGAVPLVADGYVTVDAMAKYEFNDHTSLQLNVFNVADEDYADQLHPFRVVPGAGRSALVTLGVRY